MTHSDFVREVKKLLARIGLNPALYSGHSFRRGGATYAFNVGGSPDLVQYLGDWASDAYRRYEQFSRARRLELPTLMARAIQRGELHHE